MLLFKMNYLAFLFITLYLIILSEVTGDTELEEDDHVLFGSFTPVWSVKNGQKDTMDTEYNYQLLHPVAADCIKRKNKRLLSNNYDIVYPEILIFVDYETYKYHKYNSTAVKENIVALYNNYDLILRQMTYPKIRLNIAGIVISEEEISIFSSNRTSNMEVYLNNIKKFFKENIMNRNFHYDLITIILHRNYINQRDENGFIGQADYASACSIDPVVITRSTGGFADSSMAVRYLIRAFGANFDGTPGDELSKVCEIDSRYLTGTFGDVEKTVIISDCSKDAMRKFFYDQRAACLKNKPFVGTPYKKIFPIKMSLDEQCTAANNGIKSTSKWVGNKECTTLVCSKDEKELFRFAPAQGSACNDHTGICIREKCEPYSKKE